MKAFSSLMLTLTLLGVGSPPATAVEPPKDAAVTPSPTPEKGSLKKKKKPSAKGSKGTSSSLLKDEVPPAPLPK